VAAPSNHYYRRTYYHFYGLYVFSHIPELVLPAATNVVTTDDFSMAGSSQ
jgi:hypothetical protein